MIKRFLTLFLSVLCFFAQSQEYVEYHNEFKFTDGLYIGFEDFKNNNPIPITHLVSDLDIRDADYLNQILEYDSVVYYDNMFEERQIAVQDLWGFCSRGKVFLGFGEKASFNNPEYFDFYPLLTIGKVCFFTAYEAFYRSIAMGPQMGGFQDPAFRDEMTVTESSQIQLVFKIEDGKFILADRGDLKGFPPKLTQGLIAPDLGLVTEFNDLSFKEQRQKGMFYIRKYNSRNPVSFPSY